MTARRRGGAPPGRPRERNPGRRLAGTLVATALVLGASSVAAPGAGAAPRQGKATENRVRDLVLRVRDLDYRYRSLDNSERVEETGERTTVTLAADVLFEFDKADLTSAATARLGELAAQLKALGSRPVTIAGHSDGKGEPAYNQDLSLRRARAVEGALAGGLSGGYSFEVSGHGETQPVAPNETDGADNPDGRALNRRVEISFPNR